MYLLSFLECAKYTVMCGQIANKSFIANKIQQIANKVNLAENPVKYSLTFLKFYFELPTLCKILFLEKAFNSSSSLCSLQSSSLDTENREEISFTFSAFTLSPCRARARVIAAAASFHSGSRLSASLAFVKLPIIKSATGSWTHNASTFPT